MQPCLVDLSRNQAPRDMSAMKALGIRAAIVKCTEGVGYRDPNYFRHIEAARAAQMLFGAYHFGTGLCSGEEQALFFLKTAQAAGELPRVLALDFEANRRGPSMTVAQAEEFVRTLRTWSPMRTLVLYGGEYLREQGLPATSPLAALPLWLADYRAQPVTPAPWVLWTLHQFTDHEGALTGAPDPLDGLDLSEERLPETLERLWGVA